MGRSYVGLIELSAAECRELLEAHRPRVGRVAFAESNNPDWPTILPVNYVYVDGDIYFRTFRGSKLFAALSSQQVAFEVDGVEEDGRRGWSVVLLGPLDVVVDDPPDAVRSLHSWASDAPEHVVRLQVQQTTGRKVMGPQTH